MSTKFANRRKPRKVGRDDEEDEGGVAPGMWTKITFFYPRYSPTTIEADMEISRAGR